jgi:hypothetical protein
MFAIALGRYRDIDIVSQQNITFSVEEGLLSHSQAVTDKKNFFHIFSSRKKKQNNNNDKFYVYLFNISLVAVVSSSFSSSPHSFACFLRQERR